MKNISVLLFISFQLLTASFFLWSLINACSGHIYWLLWSLHTEYRHSNSVHGRHLSQLRLGIIIVWVLVAQWTPLGILCISTDLSHLQWPAEKSHMWHSCRNGQLSLVLWSSKNRARLITSIVLSDNQSREECHYVAHQSCRILGHSSGHRVGLSYVGPLNHDWHGNSSEVLFGGALNSQTVLNMLKWMFVVLCSQIW